MERIVNLHIEKLPEGMYLATSDAIQGLVAQGRTIQETIDIARDVAKKILEAQQEREGGSPLPPAHDAFDYPAYRECLNGTASRISLPRDR